jgi:ABC-type Na+ efflux pump permease subunit
MLGVFPFVIMFLITSIAMLRERTTGTLERLLTTPLGKLDLLFGYGIAFGLMAAIQAAVAAGVAYWLFDLTTAGSTGLVILIAIANAVPASPGCSAAQPPHGVPGVQFGRRRCSRRSCCAGCSSRATRWPAGSRRSATCCR